MNPIYLITVSGKDKPGITSELTHHFSAHGASVLDIGQSVIHRRLLLGFLVQFPDEETFEKLNEELKDLGQKLDVKIENRHVESEQYQKWVDRHGEPRYIVTLVGKKIESAHLARLSEVLVEYELNIDRITRLSGRVSVQDEKPDQVASIEVSCRGFVKDLDGLKGKLLLIYQEDDVDIAVQEDDIFRRNRRLVCFDMDSTLIQTEVINELAAAKGVEDEVAKITELAMNGKIDFKESFTRRVGLLKGLDESCLKEIAENLPITPGAKRLISTLKKIGYKVAIISGGFTYFAEHLKQKLGIDDVYANHLDIKDGKLTGNVTQEIIDGPKKAEILKAMAQKYHLSLKQVIAVGDGANDLMMLSAAGMGIAFHAKPIVQEQARHAITSMGLDAILYLLGLRERDIESI